MFKLKDVSKGFIGLGFLLAVIIIFETYVTVIIPNSRKYLYDALSERNITAFWPAIAYFGFIMVSLMIELPFKGWITSVMSIKLRAYISSHLIRFNNMTIINKPGRIADDVRIVSDISIRVVTELIIAFLCLVLLIYSVKSDTLILTISISYTCLVVIVSLLFTKPMTTSRYNAQSTEQTFRRELELNSKSYKNRIYDAMTRNNFTLATINSVYFLFCSVKSRALTIILPLILLKPYMSSEISFGDLMSTMVCVDLIVENATILVNYFPDIMSTKASYKRLKELMYDKQKKNS